MRQRGFTLVELLMVTAIIGAVSSGFILAAFDDLSGTDEEIESLYGEIVDAIRYARDESIRTGLPHEIRISIFGADEEEVPIRVAQVNGDVVLHPVKGVPYEVGFCCNLRPSIILPFSSALTLQFGPDGVSQWTSSSALEPLFDCGGVGLSIAFGVPGQATVFDWILIDAITGRVRISRGTELSEWCE